MSITVKKSVEVAKNYPSLNLSVPLENEEVEIIYEIISITDLTLNAGVAFYSTKVNGVTSPANSQFVFTYDGASSPFEAAESQLQTLLA